MSAPWSAVLECSGLIMNPEFAIELLKNLMFEALLLSAPILLTAMIVGLAISLFQAVTSINEQTLSFVPKALCVLGLLLLLAGTMAAIDLPVSNVGAQLTFFVSGYWCDFRLRM